MEQHKISLFFSSVSLRQKVTIFNPERTWKLMAESVAIAVEWAKSIAPSVAKVASDDLTVLDALRASQHRKHRASVKKSPARQGKAPSGGGGGRGYGQGAGVGAGRGRGAKPPKPRSPTKQTAAAGARTEMRAPSTKETRAGWMDPVQIQREAAAAAAAARPTPTPPVRRQAAAQSQPANVGFFGSAMSSPGAAAQGPAAARVARQAAVQQAADRSTMPAGQRAHPWSSSMQAQGHSPTRPSSAPAAAAPSNPFLAAAATQVSPTATAANPFLAAAATQVSPTTAAANPFLAGTAAGAEDHSNPFFVPVHAPAPELAAVASRADVMSHQMLETLLPQAENLLNRDSKSTYRHFRYRQAYADYCHKCS